MNCRSKTSRPWANVRPFQINAQALQEWLTGWGSGLQLQGRSGWPLDTHLLVNSGHGFPANGALIPVGDATRPSAEVRWQLQPALHCTLSLLAKVAGLQQSHKVWALHESGLGCFSMSGRV